MESSSNGSSAGVLLQQEREQIRRELLQAGVEVSHLSWNQEKELWEVEVYESEGEEDSVQESAEEMESTQEMEQ